MPPGFPPARRWSALPIGLGGHGGDIALQDSAVLIDGGEDMISWGFFFHSCRIIDAGGGGVYHTSNMADWIGSEAMCATVDGAMDGDGDWCDGRNSVTVSVSVCPWNIIK